MRDILQGMQSRWAAIVQLWAHSAADQGAAGPVARREQPVPARAAKRAPAPLPWSKRILVFGETAAGPLARALGEAGYTVSEVATLPLALAGLERAQVALIVVDCPEVAATCRALRQVTKVPILALLPELTETAVLDAFGAGADDCQAVSISPSEIVLRARAILRRGNAQVPAPGDGDSQMREAA